jgi:hypothetical protein
VVTGVEILETNLGPWFHDEFFQVIRHDFFSDFIALPLAQVLLEFAAAGRETSSMNGRDQ